MLKQFIGGEWIVVGGGGGGSGDYDDLTDKPKINSHTLSGNKSSSDLGLQDVISDLETIRSGAGAGATAVQPAAMESALSGKQDEITDLETIRSGAGAGATAVQTISIGGTAQTKTNGVVDLPAYPTTLPASDTTNSYSSSGTAPISGQGVAAALGTLDVSSSGGNGKYIKSLSQVDGKIAPVEETLDTTPNSGSTKAISSAAVYNALNTETNNRVSADNKQTAALVELIDSGAKNLFKITQVKREITIKGITATYDPITGIVDINGTHDGSSGGAIFELYTGAAADQAKIPAGTYHLSGCPAGGSTSTYRVGLNGMTPTVTDTGSGVDFTISTAQPLAPRILISKPAGQEASFNHVKFKIMVSKKGDYDISPAFVPYCPTDLDAYVASKQPLAGKKISFYGDSITTFTGWIPSGNKPFYTGSNCGVNSVYHTWWMKTLIDTGAELCVDQAWSGRCVSNIRDSETDLVNSGAWRQTEVDKLAADGSTPDIIVIKLGINDYNKNAQLGTYDCTAALPVVPSAGFATFRESYATMLNRIMTTYPLARVYCCTLNQCERTGATGFPEINSNGDALSAFNIAIKQLAAAFGAGIIDHNSCGMTYYNMSEYTGDWESGTGKGLHPNAAGMQLIAEKTIAAICNDYIT